jgi:hypothetical protein
MVIIHVTREIPAPLDKVWSIISNLDKEPSYWHEMKSIRNIARMDTNIIEREVIISYRNSKCRETVMLNPKHSIEVRITVNINFVTWRTELGIAIQSKNR